VSTSREREREKEVEITNLRIGPSGKDGREKRRKKLDGAKIDGQTRETENEAKRGRAQEREKLRS